MKYTKLIRKYINNKVANNKISNNNVKTSTFYIYSHQYNYIISLYLLTLSVSVKKLIKYKRKIYALIIYTTVIELLLTLHYFHTVR